MADMETGLGIPEGFVARRAGGPFLEPIGPIWQRPGEGGSVFGIRLERRHCNNQAVAHGGMLATFADIQQKYPSLLANYRPIVQKADLGSKGVWYRLRVGPIDDKAEAYKLCGELKTQGLPDCLVMTQ